METTARLGESVTDDNNQKGSVMNALGFFPL